MNNILKYLTKIKSIKLESNNKIFKLNMTNNQEVVVSRKYQPIIKKDLNRMKYCDHFNELRTVERV